MDDYREAHLFVAAIRLFTHKHGHSPRVEDVCESLSFSIELGHAISRKLAAKEIITLTEDPFSVILSVADHTKIELLPRQEEQQDQLAKELEAFQNKKKAANRKVETIQAELQKKKQDMFADLEAKLHNELQNGKAGRGQEE